MHDPAPFLYEVDLMQSLPLEALIIPGLIVTNGLLVMARSAIESAQKSRLHNWSSQGDGAATAAFALSQDPRRLDWTVQLFTTLVATLIGMCAGVTLVPALSEAIGKSGGLAPYGQILSLAGVAAAITLVSLVISEILPRRLGLVRADRIARLVSIPIRGLSLLAVPVMGLLSSATDLVLVHAIGDLDRLSSRRSLRKKSRCSCRKAPRPASSKKASTR